MGQLQLRLFGSPALEAMAGRTIFVAERPYQLLAYLACRGSWVTRDVAASLFWPERNSATARANLRFVLVQIRRLAPVEAFEARTDALRWSVDSDVRRFERAVEAGRWADAVEICSGPLLEGFELGSPAPYVEWLQFERSRLAALWRKALAARLDQLAADPRACAALATRALTVDAIDEDALKHLLRAQLSLGRPDEARRAYREYAQRLAAELAIEPSAALRNLVREFEPRRQRNARPQAAETTTAEMPPSLIGRRIELQRIGKLLLDDTCRSLTIIGPGGVGKSLLARTAARQLAGSFASGAAWVGLEDLRSIEQVASRCLNALGAEPSAAATPRQQLETRLNAARILLVFDNAEHLPGFGAWLEDLLDAGSLLKVLVTSRVRLGNRSEWLLPLEGLPAPEVGETEVDAIRSFDAVRLFERKAVRVHPDFAAAAQPTEIAALVRAVGGLPLAIELAAAWVRLMPVAEIRRELERSLDLISGEQASEGGRVGVRESLGHSWRLLAPAEQRALAQLAVFPADFSREAASAVSGAVLPLLAALVDKSLLRTSENGRFAFHPLIRQFALEELDASAHGEAEAARTRHAEYFLALLARFNEFETMDQQQALHEVGAEFENVIAAWRWAATHARVDLLQRCAAAMEGCLDARGQQQFGLELFDLAASAIDAELPEHQLLRCHIELGRAAFRFRRGEFPEGEMAARNALQAAHRARYRHGVKSSTNTLGLMLWRRGKMKEAAFCLRDVVQRERADGDRASAALYAGNLAAIERELGHAEEAERLLKESLATHRHLKNYAGWQSALQELGILQLDRDRPAAALPFAREALEVAEASGFRRSVPYLHRLLAEAYFALNDLRLSREFVEKALAEIGTGGDRTLEPACRVRLGLIELREGRSERALAELQAAARLAKAMQSPRVQVTAATAYASYCRAHGSNGLAAGILALVSNHPSALRRQREAAAAEHAALREAPGADECETAPRSLEDALDRLLAEAPPGGVGPLPKRGSSSSHTPPMPL